MNEEFPKIIIDKRTDTELVKDLLHRLQQGFPMDENGYIEFSRLLHHLNLYVTLLTPSCDEGDIELTLTLFKKSIDDLHDKG